jgi:hypothetical protein
MQRKGSKTYSWRYLLGLDLWLVGRGLGRPSDKCWVVGIDVCGLDLDERLSIFGGRTKTLSEKLRDRLDELGMEDREALEFLNHAHTSVSTILGKGG